ncbi:MAG TPA: hypothetical protein VF444_08945 [Pseudonocardiaceae bacterium]
MTTWNFAVRLNRGPTDDEINALYEAGLSDTGIAGTFVDVDRDAPDLRTAVRSIVAQIRTIPGLEAVRIEYQDPVTIEDAAQRFGRPLPTELGGFPNPTLELGQFRLYSWAEITGWLHDVLGEEVPPLETDLKVVMS